MQTPIYCVLRLLLLPKLAFTSKSNAPALNFWQPISSKIVRGRYSFKIERGYYFQFIHGGKLEIQQECDLSKIM